MQPRFFIERHNNIRKSIEKLYILAVKMVAGDIKKLKNIA